MASHKDDEIWSRQVEWFDSYLGFCRLILAACLVVAYNVQTRNLDTRLSVLSNAGAWCSAITEILVTELSILIRLIESNRRMSIRGPCSFYVISLQPIVLGVISTCMPVDTSSWISGRASFDSYFVRLHETCMNLHEVAWGCTLLHV